MADDRAGSGEGRVAKATKGGAVRLADVARAAGVSQGTASNVFNRPDLVRAEVRERVEAAARDLGYAGPDPKGRLLRAGRVNAIGVVVADPLSYFFKDPFARVLMAGISDACDAAGAGLALVSAASEEKLAWNIRSALVDGFILCCIEEGTKLVELTRERGLPFVALELGTGDDAISAIGVDDFGGAREAGRHLGALGHRRVGILAIPFVDDRTGPIEEVWIDEADYPETRARVRGYLEGLADYGIAARDVPVYETENDEATVRAGLDYLFAADAPPTALLVMSDLAALVALDWLREHGLRVPEDVSVVGFDGVPEGEHSAPPLTTVVQPIAEKGRKAVETILTYDGTPRREVLPVSLAIRGSTAPPPAR